MVYSPGNDHIATKRESGTSSSKKVPCEKDMLASSYFWKFNQDLLSEHMNHVGKYTGSLDPMVKRPAKPRNVRFLLRYQLIELAGKWTLNEDGDFPTLLKMGIFQAAMLVDSKVDSIFGKSLFKSDVSNFLPPVREKGRSHFSLQDPGQNSSSVHIFLVSFTPPKTNMTMENQPFEDGSSIEHLYF